MSVLSDYIARIEADKAKNGTAITAEKLAPIQVLFRQSDTMCLWGIPYRMRDDVNQSPANLVRAEWKADWKPAGAIPANWIWLGSCGWWDTLNIAEQIVIRNFLAKHKDSIPTGPNEWSYLETAKESSSEIYTPP